MIIVSEKDIPEFELNREGMCGVKVKYLLHAGFGAKLQVRIFTVEVGGHTAMEKHAHSHQVFVLEGEGIIKSKNVEKRIKAGDFIYIGSWEYHQIINVGNRPLKFLCTKETNQIPEELRKFTSSNSLS